MLLRRLIESPLRLAIIILAALVEIGATVLVVDYLYTQFAWIETLLRVLSLLIVLGIVRTSEHLSSDMTWILAIMVSPILGTALYLLLGTNMNHSGTYRSIVAETERAARLYEQDPSTLQALAKEAPDEAGQFRYLLDDGGFPTYRNTGLTYYPLGDEGFPHMLEDMERAERFLFLEYFIIEPGTMWNQMLDVLTRKAAAGLDVRVLYDDVGSVGTLPASYARELEARGIKCSSFNRLNPLLNVIINHRDHRKIMVIDGLVAYTGGINLADEYINARSKYGHWKDNVLRVTGEAVWSFTVMFLTTWNALRHEDERYEDFRAETPLQGEADGFIAPYGETPLDRKIVGQNVYLNVINQARDYCYIYTPYLIIDTEMRNALMLAAQRGVDVRVVTPGVPDKRVIWDITRSHYRQLIKGGVRVFEYTPGFVHSKAFVADGRVATVGTLNLDYRSLYLHFENGVLMCGTQAVGAVHDDFVATFPHCHEMTVEESDQGPVRETLLTAARVVAPLL